MSAQESQIIFPIPEKLLPILLKPHRYNVAHGGRGSAKSHTIAGILLHEACREKHRYLCTRELQNSIRDSVHRLLSDKIYELGLNHYFVIQKDSIVSRCGSEFFFKGLRHSISEIKSMEGVDRVWVEEAEAVSMDSWDVLIPTIRKRDSRFYITFNPEDEKSATYSRFVLNPPPDANVIQVNYVDNPWFDETELRSEMEYDLKIDPEKHAHIWMGKTKKYAHALIFKGKFVKEEFETPSNAQFYFGCDFGFSNDPTCLIRMFIVDHKLFIDWEVYGIGIEIDELHRLFDTVPRVREWKVIADSARPDTISFLSKPYKHKDGTIYPPFNVVGAEKGKGSVEDGIQFIKGFERIVIHPRCPKTFDDFNNYKWKTDRVTNEILAIPADGSDHAPDAIRYALEKYTKSKLSIYDVLRQV
jgi:phage terminase large subunit